MAPNWVGDAVMCLPALRQLIRATPACAWTVCARPAVAPVFRLCGLPLEVVQAEPPGAGVGASASALLRTRWELRRAAPGPADVAVVLPNSFFSALLARMAGARRRLGYNRDGRGWLLNHPIRCPRPGEIPPHESFYYLELLRRAGLVTALPDAVEARLQPLPAQVDAWSRRMRQGRPVRVVAMHAGATFGTAKRWLPERFAELAARFAGEGIQVVLVGSPTERALAAEVADAARHRLPASDAGVPPPMNLAGETSLSEAIALLAAADLLVSNDSGPMHLAGAVGTPVVAIFGSTNERETYPLALPGRFQLVKAPGIDCSPCKLRECPIDHRCMTRIEVDEVYQAARPFLEGPRAGSVPIHPPAEE